MKKHIIALLTAGVLLAGCSESVDVELEEEYSTHDEYMEMARQLYTDACADPYYSQFIDCIYEEWEMSDEEIEEAIYILISIEE